MNRSIRGGTNGESDDLRSRLFGKRSTTNLVVMFVCLAGSGVLHYLESPEPASVVAMVGAAIASLFISARDPRILSAAGGVFMASVSVIWFDASPLLAALGGAGGIVIVWTLEDAERKFRAAFDEPSRMRIPGATRRLVVLKIGSAIVGMLFVGTLAYNDWTASGMSPETFARILLASVVVAGFFTWRSVRRTLNHEF